MAKAKVRAYFGLDWILSLLLAIFPLTNIVLGAIYRYQKGKLLLMILNILIFPVFYIIDLISIIVNKDLKYLV